ncbi:hypothetical protein [Sphingomonas trueperi]|uniref:hypothetical protein n=1 Tax=Sphingomonas trueperi TaxID=53317 RepID=UPI000F2A0323
MTSFAERAAAFGLSPEAGYAGIITIDTLEKLTSFLTASGINPSLESLRQGLAPVGDAFIDRASDAVARHIHGDTLSTEDRALADQVFPLDVYLVSNPNMTISSEWNLSAQSGGGPVVVSLGTLTVKDGGYIVINGQALDFTADALVRDGTATLPSGVGLFNILGKNGTTGTKGTTPASPGQAKSGSPGDCSSAGIAGSSGGDGTPGDPGSPGNTGNPGGAASPSMLASIRLGAVTTSIDLPIVTQSGCGGTGGVGGDGANGGRGGNGGNGATCGCTGSSGGSGAQGGRGGDGGQGGPGSNAVDAAGNVTAFLPSAVASRFPPVKLTATPGAGGQGGSGGDGGDGGGAGSGGKHNDGGSAGGSGGQGNQGPIGVASTVTGKPGEIFIQPT